MIAFPKPGRRRSKVSNPLKSESGEVRTNVVIEDRNAKTSKTLADTAEVVEGLSGQPNASVETEIGLTLSMGNFQFVKLGVHVRLPSGATDEDVKRASATFERTKQFAFEKMMDLKSLIGQMK